MVEVAFLDREGDDEAFSGRIVLRDRGDDLHVGEALAQIEPAQQIAIRLDAIRIVDVGALEKAEQPALGGLDHVLEPGVAEGAVADEGDLADRGLLPLGDLEHEIDAIVRQLDDLRLDAHVEASGMLVDVDDALHVGLHHRPRQRPARLGLHFGGQLVVLDALVALEGHPVDDRSFDHAHHQAAAGLVEPYVLKQAGGVERLEAVIDGGCVEAPTGAGTKIRADRVRLDPPIALHHDGRDRLRGRGAGREDAKRRRTQRGSAEDDANESQSPKHPDPRFHTVRAPFVFGRPAGGSTDSAPRLVQPFPRAATILADRITFCVQDVAGLPRPL